jgi:hypothetical protein
MSTIIAVPAGGKGARRPDAIPASHGRLASDRLFRSRVRCLHRCGPWATGELLGEIMAGVCPRCRDLVLERTLRYGELAPELVRLFGADDWLDQAAVLRLVTEARS